MTKSEAITAMAHGKKISHRYFSEEEWMSVEDGMYVFEDGCRCNPVDFWSDRNSVGWDDGWSIAE